MPRGRPTKLTEAMQARIVDALKLSATYEDAAARGPIDYDTFRRWMRKGERARSGEFRAFYVAVKEAEAEAVYVNLGRINMSAARAAPCPHCAKPIPLPGDPRSAQWLLERRHPEKYGRRDVHRLQMENLVDRDELTRLLDELASEVVAHVDAAELGDVGARVLNNVADGWIKLLATRYPDIARSLGDRGETRLPEARRLTGS